MKFNSDTKSLLLITEGKYNNEKKMYNEKIDKTRIEQMYQDAKNEITYYSSKLTSLEMTDPHKFFLLQHKIRVNLKVIDTIIKNLLNMVKTS